MLETTRADQSPTGSSCPASRPLWSLPDIAHDRGRIMEVSDQPVVEATDIWILLMGPDSTYLFKRLPLRILNLTCDHIL